MKIPVKLGDKGLDKKRGPQKGGCFEKGGSYATDYDIGKPTFAGDL